ncbi:meiosis expressed gene 1 protein homolog [Corticium candelabrum]|uniref:meiosis expressed gene 1 protein homolog n=1 Tax=Corticium candelabrum TaxID=121492 RepID=UPI002E26C5E2|nr:meiosis expressed gene 1 protein homolog [Corticium candelabrum]
MTLIWSPEAEEAYRIHLAGYDNLEDYCKQKNVSADEIERWEKTGFIKKLQRTDGTYYYYNQDRECKDEDLIKIKSKVARVPEK